MQPIAVLSLFDGMSCWRLALERDWIPVRRYFASEIDKYAIQVATKNFSDIHQIGDAKWVEVFYTLTWGIDHWYRIKSEWSYYRLWSWWLDLLIGGSPCQWFSNAGKWLNFNDPRSKLFFEFVRILNEAKPRYFLLENVKMKKEWQNIISEYLFGIQPVEIDSALVSAQRRKRLYRVWKRNEDWSYSQVVIKQPEDKGILLKDITLYGENRIWQLARWFNEWWIKEGKSPTLSSHWWQHNNFPADDRTWIRKITPVECERLQTLPDNYTEWVSNSQRYKMLWNGRTVDVIAHIFREMFKD